METEFTKAVFTGKSKVTLDGPDGWSKGWVLQDREAPVIKRRQQGRGIMSRLKFIVISLLDHIKLMTGVKLTQPELL